MKQGISKLMLATLLLAGIAGTARAQDETDALRYSYLSPQGTARSIGFGNALGSVGGDFSTLSVNPAGIGIYRKSEFMVTPSLTFANTDATYNGSPSLSDNGTHFAISNIGIVWTAVPHGRRYANSKWKAVSFAVGINRMADFTRNYNYSGTNNQTSSSLVFESYANQNGVDGSNGTNPGYLGYQSYLLDTASFVGGGSGYRSIVDPTTNPIRQTKLSKETGGISEIDLSLGGNYDEKLMLGATLGIPSVRYVRSTEFVEENANSSASTVFQSSDYIENLKTTGAGLNLKLGFIYKPTDNFRFGAAIHTPTYLSLTDIYSNELSVNRTDINTSPVDGDLSTYDYSMVTPWRGVVSATAMLGKFGFLTADYEYVDYSATRYHFDDNNQGYENTINNTIKSEYAGASNVRVGAEIRLDKMFMLRGGFGYYGSPYKSSFYSDGQRIDISGGIGFRLDNVFIDFAFIHHAYKNPETAYNTGYVDVSNNPILSPTAILNNSSSNAVMTIGWKF